MDIAGGADEGGPRIGETTVASQRLQAEAGRKTAIKVLLVDSHQLLAEALAISLRDDADFEVVGVRPHLTSACLHRTRPDVLLLSYFLMLAHRAQLADLRADFPELRIIILTAVLDEETLGACVQAGAVGCMTKHQSPADLARAIKQAHAGEVLFAPEMLVRLLELPRRRATEPRPARPHLTPRELEVLRALAGGLSTDEVAKQLVISPHTVRTHLKSAMSRVEARSKLEAILAAVRGGLMELPDR